MAQPTTTPRIEELRSKWKAEPRSRHFYPLAEELRKIGQFEESQEILLEGLAANPNYLSAWVSLGRLLKETGRPREAVDALARALSLDPGNVVAARLMADCYVTLGDRVEAIKKYKLVSALMPGDSEVGEIVARMQQELDDDRTVMVHRAPPPPVEATPAVAEAAFPAGTPEEPVAAMEPEPEPEPEPLVLSEPPIETAPFEDASGLAESFVPPEPQADAFEESPFDSTHPMAPPVPLLELTPSEPQAAAEPAGPAALAGSPFTEENPFEETLAEAPASQSPLELSAPGFVPAGEPEEYPEEEPASTTEEGEPEDLTATVTMADLYARQGYHESARRIYQRILEREPGNAAIQDKLAGLPGGNAGSLSGRRADVVHRLETWLSKVGRREGSHV